jgi:hypothetical protein
MHESKTNSDADTHGPGAGESISDEFYNQPARAARFLFIVSGLSITVGALSLYPLYLPHPAHQIAVISVVCTVFAMMALPIGAAVLLSALITVAAARRTSKILAEFRAGQYLARWSFDVPYWSSFIQSEQRRLRKTAWQLSGVFFCCGLLMMTIILCAMPGTAGEKSLVATCVLAGTLVIAFVAFAGIISYMRSRCRRLAVCSEAIIGSHAAYMAGDLAFWGYGIRALRGVRYIPGDPAKLELFIGLNQTAKAVTRVVDLLNIAFFNPTNSSQTTAMLLIPVPKDQEANARALFDKLAGFIPQKRSHANPHTPQTSTSVPNSADWHAPIALDTLHRSARRWWRITFVTAFIGISLFVAAVIDNIRLTNREKPVADALAAWGFYIFVFAVLVSPIALYKSARFWRNAHRVHTVHAENLVPHN